MGKGKVKRRGPRGMGSIFPDKRTGGWRGKKPIGKTAAGKTLYIERAGKTQADVRRKLAEALPPGPDVTLYAWATRWLANLSVRPSTLRTYTRTLTHCTLPTLGHVQLARLTAYDFEELARWWTTGGVAASTASLRLAHLRACLAAAVRAGVIATNPATIARKPRVERKQTRPFTPGELASIIRIASQEPHLRILALLAATGMRVGEAIALDCSDFDHATGTLSITKTQDEVENAPGPPKSPHSVRTIRVPGDALQAVRSAIGTRRAGPLFRWTTGQRVRYQVLASAWDGFLKRLAIHPYRGLHTMRHSAGTLFVAAGVPLADVARYLGDTVDTVVRHYTHPTGADPADTMEQILGGGVKVSKKPTPAVSPRKASVNRHGQ